jgi:hypothetical protein
MSDGAPCAELIGLDWGIRQLPPGGFDAALNDVLAGWPACPLLASGMVGSRDGWREVPYVDLPAGHDAVARALSFIDHATPLQLIGNAPLCHRYAAAASCSELGMALPPPGAAALGLRQIARSAGLTEAALTPSLAPAV